MRYCLAASLCLVATAAQAEWIAWEQNKEIWATDLETDISWKISRGGNAHSPKVDGRLAVWIVDWSWSADVMGYFFGTGMPAYSVQVQPAVASDPQVSWISNGNTHAFYAWRQDGGLWARESAYDIRTPWVQPQAIVPDYTGPYTLDGSTLTWDGGNTYLPDYAAVVPEPSTLLLLGTGGLALLSHGWRRRRRRIGS